MNETLDLNRFHDINDLRLVMKALRDKANGCPWDSVQTHESIRQDCLEEAYEVCDAIDRNDMADLKEELGDLLLQVVFHSAMEEEKGNFTFDDVCDAVATKMIQRHPHVFKDREGYIGAEKYDMWETAKREEHGQRSTADAVDGVAHTLPSVWRLSKMVKKAGKAGFEEYPSLKSSADLLVESIENGAFDNIGDIYSEFMLSLVSRLYGKIDMEKTLQDACDRFAGQVRCWEEHHEN
jgi:tetrapyrrole methylase family protein/MazG family protein